MKNNCLPKDIKTISKKAYLHYYNDYLLSRKLISITEYNKMANAIEAQIYAKKQIP